MINYIMDIPTEDIEYKQSSPGTKEEDIVILETDPLLRRQVRMCRIREDEGAVEYAARLFFSGIHMDTAAEIAKVSERRVREYLKTDKGKVLAEEVREALDAEFKSLYGDAIEVIRAEMRNPKAEIRMSAVNTALRYLKDIKVTLEVGAEDLVQKIMRGGEDNG
jgi:hypothetical protein